MGVEYLEVEMLPMALFAGIDPGIAAESDDVACPEDVASGNPHVA